LIKQGAGNLILGGVGGTSTGGTRIENGTVTVNANATLGSGALTFAQTAANATSVVFQNTNQSIGSLNSVLTATTGTVDQRLTLMGTTLVVNQTSDGVFGYGAVNTLTSTLAGTGQLVKNGAASLTLAGDHSGFTGQIVCADGKLVMNSVMPDGKVYAT